VNGARKRQFTLTFTIGFTPPTMQVIENPEIGQGEMMILDTGKSPNWAGATPLRCHGNRGGRSSPANREWLCSPCVLSVSS
jgi:hypothetical protein